MLASIAVAAAVLIGGAVDGVHADGAPSAGVPPPARLRNGRPTFDFPAVGVLSADNSLCTGTLIGCRTVLTAAHCVCSDGAPACTPSGQVAPEHVHLFFQHAGFAETSAINANIGAIDLALVTLAEPITGIVPARLNSLNRPPPGATATVAGFGTEGFAEMVPQGVGVKRAASLGLTACPDMLFDLAYLCGGVSAVRDPGICSGDSGAPLLVNDRAGPVITGVASFAVGNGAAECAPPFTEFFVDVQPWRSAIATNAPGEVSSASCGDLAAVGTPEVMVYPFTGELSPSIDEIGGDFEVPAGVAVLRVTMNGALVTGSEQNNFDLFVGHEGECSPVCSDTRPTAFGACEIISPAAGSWRVRARRLQGQGEVQVTATLFAAAGDGPEASGATPPQRIDGWRHGDADEIEARYGDGSTSLYVDGRPVGSGHGEAPRVAVLRQIDASAECVGDCDGCGSVTIDELVRLVQIAVGTTPLSACPGGRLAGPVTISALIQAVNAALHGCTSA